MSKELSSGKAPECYSKPENHTEIRDNPETESSAVLCHFKSCIFNFAFFFFFFNLLIAKKVEALSLPPQIHFAKINDITLCRTETAAITRMVTVCGMCCRW